MRGYARKPAGGGSASITSDVIAVPHRRLRSPLTEVGVLLRGWRRRRGLSQLALAGAAGVSARHLSFVETGRSRPSRAMLLRLGEHLDVPLRDRNALLLAAGLAPAYPQRRLDDPPMAAVADAVARILTAYEPYPALVVDRHWELVDANHAVAVLTAGCAPPCSSRRATCCGSACIPTASPRASGRSGRGGRTCSPGCATRSPRPATRGCRSCSTSCAATRRRRPTRPGTPRRSSRSGSLHPTAVSSPSCPRRRCSARPAT